MTPERTAKFRSVAANRQFDLTVILENVHDPHNISAVLRSADSVGIAEIYVLYTDPQLDQDRLELGKSTSAGARKWVDVRFYSDPEACFRQVKSKYDRIYSTHLDEAAADLYDLDLSQSVALLFGNERDGLSETALGYSDGNFLIPQVGMVESLNISVACAVTLYEAFRQRREKGAYPKDVERLSGQQQALFEEYGKRHLTKQDKRWVKRLDGDG